MCNVYKCLLDYISIYCGCVSINIHTYMHACVYSISSPWLMAALENAAMLERTGEKWKMQNAKHHSRSDVEV